MQASGTIKEINVYSRLTLHGSPTLGHSANAALVLQSTTIGVKFNHTGVANDVIIG